MIRPVTSPHDDWIMVSLVWAIFLLSAGHMLWLFFIAGED